MSFFGIHIEGLGAGLQNVTIPEALQGAVSVGGIEINAYRTFIIGVTAVFTLITWALHVSHLHRHPGTRHHS